MSIAFLFNGCAPPPAPEPVKPDFYSPIEIKPLTLKTTIAIPTIENAIIGQNDNSKILLMLENLSDLLVKDFEDSGRFNVMARDDIVSVENKIKATDGSLLEKLEGVDLVLYLLALSRDETKSEILCGGYLVTKENGQVVERFKVGFNYTSYGGKLEFDEKQIYKFSMNLVRKYPRLRGRVISRSEKSVCIGLENREKTFVGQQAIVYNEYSQLDPKFKSHEHSLIPVSEVQITGIQNNCLMGVVIQGNEDEIEAGDIVILK